MKSTISSQGRSSTQFLASDSHSLELLDRRDWPDRGDTEIVLMFLYDLSKNRSSDRNSARKEVCKKVKTSVICKHWIHFIRQNLLTPRPLASLKMISVFSKHPYRKASEHPNVNTINTPFMFTSPNSAGRLSSRFCKHYQRIKQNWHK